MIDVASITVEEMSPAVRVIDDRGKVDLAGRILHPALPRRELLRLLANADESTLASHLISASALEALERGDDAGFLAIRHESIVTWLHSFTDHMAEWGSDDSPPLTSLAEEDD